MAQDETIPSHASHLPRQVNPLVGRATEVAQLRQQLLDPACRLLTLLGPGGMGKTRLAIEVATSLQDEFAVGVHFVNLQPLNDPAQLPTALADALHFPLSGSDPVESQLLRYLANKELLLLLDNFEHLLAGADFLSELLLQAPGVKVVVTSREVLNLQEEWLFPLIGLAFPTPGFDPQTLEQYAAAALFIERMRRVRPQFVLAEEAAAIGRICQWVEGMPLALELAACWTKTLTCAEIAAEIEHNLDFLRTQVRNIPERHRNLRAVFLRSWQLLPPSEQAVFKQLAVFRGGFVRTTAEKVAGATPAILTALLDKSLLQRGNEGRYQIHELLRQFGEEQLQQDRQEAHAAHAHHATFYLQFLQQRLPDILGQRQLAACAEIRAELANIRASWAWAVDQQQHEMLLPAAATLSQFCQIHARFREGVDLFELAVQRLTASHPGRGRNSLLITLQALLGWLYIRLADVERGERAFQQSRQLTIETFGMPTPGLAIEADLGLGVIALFQGDSARGAALIEAVRQSREKAGDPYSYMIALYWSARAQMGLQQRSSALAAAQQALTLAESIGERWFSAYIFDALGHLADVQQDAQMAQHYYERSYARHQEFGDQAGMALAQNYMAGVALRQRDYASAKAGFLQSLALHQQHHDVTGMISAWNGLSAVALATNELDAARHYLAQALQNAVQHKLLTLTPVILCGIGELLLKMGQVEQSVAPLTFILRTSVTDYYHATSDPDTSQRAQQLLDQAQARLPADRYQAAREHTPTALPDLTPILLAALAAAWLPQSDPPAPNTTAIAEQGLAANAAMLEPLTKRELEILTLIAAGHTNGTIAEQLIVSVGTVKSHTGQIFGKLGVHTRTQAIVQARKLGLLPA